MVAEGCLGSDLKFPVSDDLEGHELAKSQFPAIMECTINPAPLWPRLFTLKAHRLVRSSAALPKPVQNGTLFKMDL